MSLFIPNNCHSYAGSTGVKKLSGSEASCRCIEEHMKHSRRKTTNCLILLTSLIASCKYLSKEIKIMGYYKILMTLNHRKLNRRLLKLRSVIIVKLLSNFWKDGFHLRDESTKKKEISTSIECNNLSKVRVMRLHSREIKNNKASILVT